MKLTKKLEAEIKALMDDYWDSYFRGDLKYWKNFLVNDYRNIGGTEEEIWNTKKEILDYSQRMMDQIVEVSQIRNKKTQVITYDPYFMVHEFMDVYIKPENKWTFYGKFRLSSLIQKINGNWKVLHQHGSYPDSHTEEGEAFAFDKIKKENTQLKEAVKRRTLELEEKNQELRIETALEKVRSIAMGMQHENDMLQVCQIITEQLQQLGISTIRNVQTAVIDQQKGTYLNYEFFNRTKKEVITQVAYNEQQDIKVFVRRITKDPDAFFTTSFSGNKLKDWVAYQRKAKQYVDPYTVKAKSLHYYFYAIEGGALGISTYAPSTKEETVLFKRFRNVFQLSYQRYVDIAKEAAQARQAQIEAAMEKVRSRSLAMQKPEELLEVAELLRKEMALLGVEELETSSIYIQNKEDGTTECWYAFKDIQGKDTTLVSDEMTLNLQDTWVGREMWKFYRSQKKQVSIVMRGELRKEWINYCAQRSKVLKGYYGAEIPERTYHLVKFAHGYIGAASPGIISEDSWDLLHRATAVFSFTYTRFLDLQDAAARAREAQIELALERVRARSLAMHHTSEMQAVIHTVHEELLKLNLSIVGGSFVVINKDVDTELRCWGAGGTANTSTEVYVPHFNMPFCTNLIKGIKKGPGFFTEAFTQKEKIAYFTELFRHEPWSKLSAKEKKEVLQAPGNYTRSVCVAKYTSIFIINQHGRKFTEEENAILKRFTTVFEQSYTRFLDLKKAEAQARKAEIELGLERVRARAMAMQRSGELAELVATVFRELTQLGLSLASCIIWIHDPGKRSNTLWIASDEMNKPACPLHIHPFYPAFFNSIIAAWKQKDPKWIFSLTGTEKQKFQKLFFENYPELPESLKSPVSKNKQIVFSASFNDFGALEIVATEPLTDDKFEILHRFGKVFNTSYTRFNDLQKAEAQTREAEIQLALERVRARSLAMHHPSELQDVVNIAAQQLMGMGMDINGGVFICINAEANDVLSIWASGGMADYVQKITVPALNRPIFTQLRDAVRQGNHFLIEAYDDKEKQALFKHLFKHEPWSSLPDERKKELLSRKGGFARSVVICHYTSISITNHNGKAFSEEENEILKRFGNVFEQSFIRFLDLQKAEEQAREAQLQLALERVRARTMAMQKSSELGEIAALLFHQVKALGIESYASGFTVWENDDTELVSWMSNADGSVNPPFRMPAKENVWHRRQLDSWRKHEDFITYDFSGKEMQQYYAYLRSFPLLNASFKKSEASGAETPQRQVHNAFNFAHGNLLFITLQPVPESYDIFKRFAKTFEQSYTRFLDLQKAEAQAREAQIEAALERVRSRTMAMQKSTELNEVAIVLFEQIRLLGGQLWGTGFALCNAQEGSDEFWFANEMGVMPPVSIPNDEDEVHSAMLQGWKQNHEYLLLEKGGDALAAHYAYLYALPQIKAFFDPMLAAGFTFPTWQQWHAAYFSKGYLLIITTETYAESDIFKRFAKVFDQTYTRFLDLQKAEAQAKEAQIEAALERIRSKVTAMQESHELLDIVVAMRNEFVTLGLEAQYFWYMRWLPEKYEKAMTSGDGTRIGMVMTLPRHIHGDVKLVADWERSNEPALVFPMDVDTAVEYIEKMITLGDFQQVDPQAPSLDDIRHIGGLTFVMARTSQGEIGYSLPGAVPNPPAKDVETLTRFAGVFDLAYRRFEDLKQAEQRNRQTQIELALERTRTQSMLMQHSNELLDISKVFHEQLLFLHIDAEFSFVWLPNEGKGDHLFWATWMEEQEGEKQFLTKAITYPLDMTEPYTAGCFRDWRSGLAVHEHFIEPAEVENFFISWQDLLEGAKQLKPSYFPEGIYYTEAYMRYGCFGIDIRRPLSQQEKDILLRFAIEFERAYTRFLDLQKAEAQAREAQIEAALERVRSRSMGMQKSEELKEVIQIVYEQLVHLKMPVEHTGFILDYKNRNDYNSWIADHLGSPSYITIPYFKATYYDQFNEAKRQGQNFFAVNLNLKEKNKFYRDLFKHLPGFPEASKEFILKQPALTISTVLLDDVALYIENFSGTPYSNEENDVLMRFGKVFQQTYTRFLDLKKAEAQARENQIQLALERVRARTMAMQRSEELKETSLVLYEQLKILGEPAEQCTIGIIKESEGVVEISATLQGNKMHQTFRHNIDEPIVMSKVVRGWKDQHKSLVLEFKERELQLYNQFRNELVGKEIFPVKLLPGDRWIVHLAYFSMGMLALSTNKPRPKESLQLLERFAIVFEQTYTRFLDLQKAEAQAREAQVEAALERVRSRSLAMHKSEELSDLSLELVKQVQTLGVKTWFCAFNIYDDDPQGSLEWGSNGEGTFPIYRTPREGVFLRYYEAGQRGETLLINPIGKDECPAHYEYLCSLPGVGDQLLKMKAAGIPFPAAQIDHVAYFKYGYLLFISYEPVPESHDIFKRFAKVFEQTYTRFLDLQRAEAQAREAQIEASLERVRSKTMAMHNSREVGETVVTLFDELVKLGLDELDRCGIGIQHQDYVMEAWTASKVNDAKAELVIGHINMKQHPLLQGTYEAWRDKKKTFQYILEGEDKINYFTIINNQPDYKARRDIARLPARVVLTAFYFREGCLYAFSSKVPSDETARIFTRFARVFGQTYRRYLDLQKAEAQAQEAIRRASIERVRGDIASMRTTEDLQRITPLMWNELTALGVPFFRCGVFIIHEQQAAVHVYLSTPEGKSIASLQLAFGSSQLTYEAVANWRKQQVYQAHWEREDFKAWVQTLMQQGHLQQENQYTAGAEVPESLWLHFIPFAQGMLYVGSKEALHQDQLALAQSLADAFATAYARYEDFVRLEAANRQIENTLEDLKATQRQLIQSEKMASLGELTAGIAHEIQNPLNFVNNFSEVSSELLDEMTEELNLGNTVYAKEIAGDIKQNLEKINHHGKRADAIVKGMLQHSQKSTGQKEPTDINALCDEYLRLVFHGLRAKDNSFNAAFSTNLDSSIGLINVIPQEIGRVLLNLFNNAFYALAEKTKTAGPAYSPQVTVSTKRVDNNVEISVADNGNGIPDYIRDKIFQPFFTTKPTGQGTGLGLSLSYDIVKSHGGEIKVEAQTAQRQPGDETEGTKLVISLPA